MATAVMSTTRLGYDLATVIEELEKVGDLKRAEKIDWNLELGTLTELVALQDGPALLFDQITGYPAGHRVLTNLMNSPRRVGWLLGLGPEVRGAALVRAIKERLTGMPMIPPREVARAAFAEETHRGDDVNLWEFPTPFWHELDGGRYIGTAGVVVTRDLDAGWVNLGTYRVEIHDEKTLGIFIEPAHHATLIAQKYWAQGKDCPIALCIGVQPGVLMSSFLGVPWGVSEYDWAGGLMGEPAEVVISDVTGLPLPSSAEIVIEGFMPDPAVTSAIEGPFGETTGYYASGASEEPIIRVTSIQHRAHPVLVGSPPLRPPASSSASYLFRAANIWTEIERSGVPEVRGVWMMPQGSSYFLTVISIKQRYPGHSKQVALAAMSGRAGGGNYGRFVFVVDDDIDPSDTDQVLWAVATRCDPETAIDVIRAAPTGYIDPLVTPEKRAALNFTASRAVVNACRPYHWAKQFAPVAGASPELSAKTRAAWPEFFQD